MTDDSGSDVTAGEILAERSIIGATSIVTGVSGTDVSDTTAGSIVTGGDTGSIEKRDTSHTEISFFGSSGFGASAAMGTVSAMSPKSASVHPESGRVDTGETTEVSVTGVGVGISGEISGEIRASITGDSTGAGGVGFAGIFCCD